MDKKEEDSRPHIQEHKKEEGVSKNNMFKLVVSQKKEHSHTNNNKHMFAQHAPQQSQSTQNHFNNTSSFSTLKSSFSKEKKTSNVMLDVNNGEMFPTLDGDINITPILWNAINNSGTSTTQSQAFDYKTIIVKRRPPPEPTDDIPAGWAKLYYDEGGQYVEDYKSTPGWRDPIPIERDMKHKQEVQDIFNERERNKRERIELFGDEGIYFQERDPFYSKDNFDNVDAIDSDGDDIDALCIDNGYKSKNNRKSNNNCNEESY